MKKLMLILPVILMTQFAWATAVSDRFVNVWTLTPDQHTPVVRAALTADVMETLQLETADDLMVTDQNDEPVPFRRLSRHDLVETLIYRQELSAQAALIAAQAHDASPLELELEHDGTRLVVRSPRLDRDRQAQGELRFEALIGAPDEHAGLPRRELVIELGSLHPLDLDCRLRDADDESPASRRVVLTTLGDTRPRRYQARLPVEDLPRAWHLGCYGQQAPADLELVQASLEGWSERNHRQVLALNPELQAHLEPDTLAFELDAPWRALRIGLASTEPNLLSNIVVQSRGEAKGIWRERARLALSTLDNDTAALVPLSNADHLRHRHWRLLTNPGLRQAPTVTIEAQLEELVFFAQGSGPWRLYAGSLEPVAEIASEQLVTETVSRLGPAWNWPRIDPTHGREAAGIGALEPPPAEIPWQRYLLWLVLFIGAGIIAVIAVKLLREGD